MDFQLDKIKDLNVAHGGSYRGGFVYFVYIGIPYL